MNKYIAPIILIMSYIPSMAAVRPPTAGDEVFMPQWVDPIDNQYYCNIPCPYCPTVCDYCQSLVSTGV